MRFELQTIHQISDPGDDNIDVIVTLEDGRRFGATFFTLTNIARLLDRYRVTGECAKGLYFWAIDMILVREITMDVMRESISSLIAEGEIEHALSRIREDE